MPDISAETVKQLREETGVSVMQCKKALEEAGGDMAKAMAILRRKGAEAAAKKGERTLGAGAVAAYIHGAGSVGALVELDSETDFVSKHEDFRALAYEVAMQVAATNPSWMRFEDVPADEIARTTEVLAPELEGRPEDMKAKILDGKLRSVFGEKCLLDQPYIKDPNLTVRNLLEGATQKFGERIEVARFARFAAGK